MNLHTLVTKEQKKELRKIRTLPDRVKAICYGGNHGGPAVTVQLNSDVRLYGLYEALLYVEGYEPEYYKPGTAEKALKAALDPELDEDEEVVKARNAKATAPWSSGLN